MTVEEFKSAYQHNYPIPVAWNDMDAMGHVNNAKYFVYFESGRVAFLQDFENLMPMPRVGIGPILAYIDCQFVVALTYPDDIIVGSRVIDVGNTSIKMEQAIYSLKLGKIAASSKSVVVVINYDTGEKVRVPDTVRGHFSRKA